MTTPSRTTGTPLPEGVQVMKVQVLLAALRHSHDRLAALVSGLAPADLARLSGSSEWSVAEVMSHLGSQAEIFSLFFDAGLGVGEVPPREAFEAIWASWNARQPAEQASASLAVTEALTARLEALPAASLGAFRVEMFGAERDAATVLRMRLSEHAVHSWDVAVAFDPAAVVAAESVALLVDGLAQTAARSGKSPDEPLEVTIVATAPDRRFRLAAGNGEVRLEVAGETASASGEAGEGKRIELPAEALVRLVYGRLAEQHPARGPVGVSGLSIEELVAVFPGF